MQTKHFYNLFNTEFKEFQREFERIIEILINKANIVVLIFFES